jgi:predicted DCC family thiol-disulfide oxidoreductase YuxK
MVLIPSVEATKPVLIYDGECGFCRRSVGWVRCRAGGRLEVLRREDAAARFPAVPLDLTARSVVLLDPDGVLHRGAEAVFRTRALLGFPFLLNRYRSSRWFAGLSEAGYRLVSWARPVLSASLDLLLGPPGENR